jgi:SAM-dependent methyltransferase
MQLDQPGPLPVASDLELIAARLPLAGARLLELGCGSAQTTREIAEKLPVAEIIATEVDRIQHAKNLAIDDLPKVTFRLGGAEDIDLDDASVDAVIMLKSLHHVPRDRLDRALREIRRVLRSGGLAYISEPVYAGAFNDILRLFNDEQRVRKAAFEALRRAVEEGLFELVEERFFDSLSRFHGFAEFEERVLGATHTEFAVDAELLGKIKAAFLPHVGADGVAEFRNPHRLDLLRRP